MAKKITGTLRPRNVWLVGGAVALAFGAAGTGIANAEDSRSGDRSPATESSPTTPRWSSHRSAVDRAAGGIAPRQVLVSPESTRRPVGARASATPFRTSLTPAWKPGTVASVFISNGTAGHPDGGVLIGNGYSWTAETCPSGSCAGGKAGLVGNGGAGFNGGRGGNALFVGSGGNGGAGGGTGYLGLAGNGGNGGDSTAGGNGGNGGTGGGSDIYGGTGGTGGSGVVGGNGGDGGVALSIGFGNAVGGSGGNGGAGTATGGNGGRGGDAIIGYYPLGTAGNAIGGTGGVGGTGATGGNGGDGGMANNF